MVGSGEGPLGILADDVGAGQQCAVAPGEAFRMEMKEFFFCALLGRFCPPVATETERSGIGVDDVETFCKVFERW